MAENNERLTAYILDNEVVELFKTDERLAAIFLSEPIVVDVTDNHPIVRTGQKYDPETKTFS